jgi:hypothetical protein
MRVPTRPGIKTFSSAPKDFDPFAASDSALKLYGYPRRPDPKREPKLRILWERMLAKRPTLIEPGFVEDRKWHSRPRHQWKKGDFGLAGDWAGAILQTPANYTAVQQPNYVFTEFAVPFVQTTPQEPGTQIVGFWTGLGGFNTDSLLQAGIAATMTGNSVSYWAWTEWFPAGDTPTNLTVNAGDLISVMVCALEPTSGTVWIYNQTTNEAVSAVLSDPLGNTPYDSSTVEWVIEAIATQMPNFGSVTFSSIHVGAPDVLATDFNLANANTINTIDTNGDTLATGNLLPSQDQVVVSWDAPS